MSDLLTPPASASNAGGDRSYWRSLEALSGGPEYERWLRQEFEDGADLPPDAVSRRRFFGVVAASVALAGMTSCRKPFTKILPFAKRPEGRVNGQATFYASALPVSGYAVGTLVTTHDGRPTMINGNPEHPMSLGGASTTLIGELLNLYDPARSRMPVKGGVIPEAHGEHGAAAGETMATFTAAWSGQLATLSAARGKGLAFLMEPSSSPTLHAMVKRVTDLLPEAKFYWWSPVNRDQEVEGSKLAFGQALDVHYDLKQANVIACFDNDLLNAGPAALAYARAWGERRKAPATTAELPRLYVAEPNFTPTGASADHRFRLRACDIGPAVFALGAALLDQGGNASALGDDLAKAFRAHKEHGFKHRGKDWIAVLAKDLLASRGRAFVCVGSRQPAAVHAAAHAINAMLGATGAVVQYTATPAALAMNATASIRELAAAMTDVKALVCVGTNPVYDAPADLGFKDKFVKVQFTVHLGLHCDETGKAATWHVPQSHPLEAWDDGVAYDGTASIAQPMIAPLYESASPVEFLARLVEYKTSSSYELVRDTWKASNAGGDGFDRWWERALHDGMVRGSAAQRASAPPVRGAEVAGAVAKVTKPATGGPQNLEVAFVPHASVGDGRNTNNAWMQETPHPVTKLTWDNAALMSLDTARALNVTLGDVIAITVAGRKLDMAVWIVPGHADWSITAELGFGRDLDAHHVVAKGSGFDTYKLRGSDALGFAVGATAAKTGEAYPMATTQDHGTIEGRALYRENNLIDTPLATGAVHKGYRSEPDFAPKMSPLDKAARLQGKVEKDINKSLWEERKYEGPYQWGMVIDLNTCTGCNACVTACVSENNIPVVGKPQIRKGRELQWLRIDRYFTAPIGQPEVKSIDGIEDSKTIADAQDPQMVTQPIPCMQCENAPCESVCPVAATTHSHEGLNDMVYNRCIGTRYCSNNCPFKVRRFNFFNFVANISETEKMAMNPQVTVRARGVMEKCTYCVQRIEVARNVAKREARLIKDGEVTSACAQACPTQAITFGNIFDKDSAVSRLKAHSLNYAMLSELNIKPRTTYLARIRNPHPELV